MSAGLILGSTLRAYGGLSELVPVTSIMAGKRPPAAALNNLLITRVSWTRSPLLAHQPTRHVQERAQVTVQARTHQDRVDILKAVVDACDLQTIAALGSLALISIVSAGGGPDFEDDAATIFMGSHDFFVDYNEPA